jgi:uncharacterized protein YciI
MQFVVICRDGTDKEALNRRLAVRVPHLELSEQHQKTGKRLLGSALLDDQGQMIGSFIICNFPSRKELDAWFAEDPYVTGKVWQKIEIKPARMGPSFAHLLRA